MINFEEELAKYKPSKEIENLEDELFQRDLTDMTDILFQMICLQRKLQQVIIVP